MQMIKRWIAVAMALFAIARIIRKLSEKVSA